MSVINKLLTNTVQANPEMGNLNVVEGDVSSTYEASFQISPNVEIHETEVSGYYKITIKRSEVSSQDFDNIDVESISTISTVSYFAKNEITFVVSDKVLGKIPHEMVMSFLSSKEIDKDNGVSDVRLGSFRSFNTGLNILHSQNDKYNRKTPDYVKEINLYDVDFPELSFERRGKTDKDVERISNYDDKLFFESTSKFSKFYLMIFELKTDYIDSALAYSKAMSKYSLMLNDIRMENKLDDTCFIKFFCLGVSKNSMTTNLSLPEFSFEKDLIIMHYLLGKNIYDLALSKGLLKLADDKLMKRKQALDFMLKNLNEEKIPSVINNPLLIDEQRLQFWKQIDDNFTDEKKELFRSQFIHRSMENLNNDLSKKMKLEQIERLGSSTDRRTAINLPLFSIDMRKDPLSFDVNYFVNRKLIFNDNVHYKLFERAFDYMIEHPEVTLDRSYEELVEMQAHTQFGGQTEQKREGNRYRMVTIPVSGVEKEQLFLKDGIFGGDFRDTTIGKVRHAMQKEILSFDVDVLDVEDFVHDVIFDLLKNNDDGDWLKDFSLYHDLDLYLEEISEKCPLSTDILMRLMKTKLGNMLLVLSQIIREVNASLRGKFKSSKGLKKFQLKSIFGGSVWILLRATGPQDANARPIFFSVLTVKPLCEDFHSSYGNRSYVPKLFKRPAFEDDEIYIYPFVSSNVHKLTHYLSCFEQCMMALLVNFEVFYVNPRLLIGDGFRDIRLDSLTPNLFDDLIKKTDKITRSQLVGMKPRMINDSFECVMTFAGWFLMYFDGRQVTSKNCIDTRYIYWGAARSTHVPNNPTQMLKKLEPKIRNRIGIFFAKGIEDAAVRMTIHPPVLKTEDEDRKNDESFGVDEEFEAEDRKIVIPSDSNSNNLNKSFQKLDNTKKSSVYTVKDRDSKSTKSKAEDTKGKLGLDKEFEEEIKIETAKRDNPFKMARSEDRWSNVVNFITGNLIDSYRFAIHIFYIGTARNKNDRNQKQSFFRILVKTAQGELTMREADLLLCSMGDVSGLHSFKQHEWSYLFASDAGDQMADMFKKQFGQDWKGILENKIDNYVLSDTFEDLATLKASAMLPKKWEYDPKEPTNQRRKATEGMIEVLGFLDTHLWVENIDKVLHKMEEEGFFFANLYEKEQLNASREIYVTYILCRLLQRFAENIMKPINIETPTEYLTKGDMKITKSDSHISKVTMLAYKNNMISITCFCTRDAKRWAQSYTMPVFMGMSKKIIPDKYHKILCRILNLITNKRLEVPAFLLEQFTKYPEEKSFDPEINELKDQFLGRSEYNDLMDPGANFMKNLTNFMQGQLHYWSSSVHATATEHHRMLCKKLFNTFIKKGWLPEGSILIMDFKESSDDSQDERTVLLPSSVMNGKRRSTYMQHAKEFLMICSRMKTDMYPYFSCAENEYKSAVMSFTGTVEFNSHFFVANTLESPIGKFAYAAMSPKPVVSLATRMNTYVDGRRALVENGASTGLAAFAQVLQARLFYCSYGMGLIPFFREKFWPNQKLIRHPVFGSFLYEPELTAGILSQDFTRFYSFITEKNSYGYWIEKMMTSNFTQTMTEEGSISFDAELHYGNLISYKKFLSRMIKTTFRSLGFDARDWRGLAKEIDLYQPSTSKETALFWTLKKCFNPKAAEGFSYESVSRLMASAVFVLTAAAILFKKRETFYNFSDYINANELDEFGDFKGDKYNKKERKIRQDQDDREIIPGTAKFYIEKETNTKVEVGENSIIFENNNNSKAEAVEYFGSQEDHQSHKLRILDIIKREATMTEDEKFAALKALVKDKDSDQIYYSYDAEVELLKLKEGMLINPDLWAKNNFKEMTTRKLNLIQAQEIVLIDLKSKFPFLFNGSVYDDPLDDVSMSTLFPSKDFYLQILDIIENVKMNGVRIQNKRRAAKLAIFPIPKMKKISNIKLSECVKAIWFSSKKVKYTYEELSRSFELYRSMFPWLEMKESDTLKNPDCPFEDEVSLSDFIKTLDVPNRSFRVLSHVRKGLPIFSFLESTCKFNFSKVFEFVEGPAQSMKQKTGMLMSTTSSQLYSVLVGPDRKSFRLNKCKEILINMSEKLHITDSIDAINFISRRNRNQANLTVIASFLSNNTNLNNILGSANKGVYSYWQTTAKRNDKKEWVGQGIKKFKMDHIIGQIETSGDSIELMRVNTIRGLRSYGNILFDLFTDISTKTTGFSKHTNCNYFFSLTNRQLYLKNVVFSKDGNFSKMSTALIPIYLQSNIQVGDIEIDKLDFSVDDHSIKIVYKISKTEQSTVVSYVPESSYATWTFSDSKVTDSIFPSWYNSKFEMSSEEVDIVQAISFLHETKNINRGKFSIIQKTLFEKMSKDKEQKKVYDKIKDLSDIDMANLIIWMKSVLTERLLFMNKELSSIIPQSFDLSDKTDENTEKPIMELELSDVDRKIFSDDYINDLMSFDRELEDVDDEEINNMYDANFDPDIEKDIDVTNDFADSLLNEMDDDAIDRIFGDIDSKVNFDELTQEKILKQQVKNRTRVIYNPKVSMSAFRSLSSFADVLLTRDTEDLSESDFNKYLATIILDKETRVPINKFAGSRNLDIISKLFLNAMRKEKAKVDSKRKESTLEQMIKNAVESDQKEILSDSDDDFDDDDLHLMMSLVAQHDVDDEHYSTKTD